MCVAGYCVNFSFNKRHLVDENGVCCETCLKVNMFVILDMLLYNNVNEVGPIESILKRLNK